MQITDVRITRTKNNRRQLADVSIVFDGCLLIKNIKLIDNGKKRFVEFSHSRRVHSGCTSSDIIPLNSEIRNHIEDEIIARYDSVEGGAAV